MAGGYYLNHPHPILNGYYRDNAVSDCAVIAVIANTVSGQGELGGLFGSVPYDTFTIRSSYFTGGFACDDCASVTLGGNPVFSTGEPAYVDVYSTVEFDSLPTGVTFIALADLMAGTPLPGLSAFRFREGSYPDFPE
ncbi:MAG: hypothetical protein A2Y16_00390 [Tenericutes bacterium GWF2_57_13]|nr:MAG: hypothetical protein A2Y16_00390 [Tenericutes bacterium GWF2_57_13]